VEYVELDRSLHPYYIATQAHPEFKSRPTRAHPLFAGLVGAALERQRSTRLLEVDEPEVVGEEHERLGQEALAVAAERDEA
jgi:CTP synthase